MGACTEGPGRADLSDPPFRGHGLNPCFSLERADGTITESAGFASFAKGAYQGGNSEAPSAGPFQLCTASAAPTAPRSPLNHALTIAAPFAES
jgi:hypothetical protein